MEIRKDVTKILENKVGVEKEIRKYVTKILENNKTKKDGKQRNKDARNKERWKQETKKDGK